MSRRHWCSPRRRAKTPPTWPPFRGTPPPSPPSWQVSPLEMPASFRAPPEAPHPADRRTSSRHLPRLRNNPCRCPSRPPNRSPHIAPCTLRSTPRCPHRSRTEGPWCATRPRRACLYRRRPKAQTTRTLGPPGCRTGTLHPSATPAPAPPRPSAATHSQKAATPCHSRAGRNPPAKEAGRRQRRRRLATMSASMRPRPAALRWSEIRRCPGGGRRAHR
mmetsp:Transcript_66474/g.191899  ORF Transcript_66474/g.191899 Transcript_66474/m.191899 type:complete len:218 (+) Transcript_66474:107-760(+)